MWRRVRSTPAFSLFLSLLTVPSLMSSVPRPRSSSFGDEQAEGDLPVDQLVKTAEQLKNDSELPHPFVLVASLF